MAICSSLFGVPKTIWRCSVIFEVVALRFVSNLRCLRSSWSATLGTVTPQRRESRTTKQASCKQECLNLPSSWSQFIIGLTVHTLDVLVCMRGNLKVENRVTISKTSEKYSFTIQAWRCPICLFLLESEYVSPLNLQGAALLWLSACVTLPYTCTIWPFVTKINNRAPTQHTWTVGVVPV